jgi:NADP-dependent 3-hydroxy acid dehydrogenase YdfG
MLKEKARKDASEKVAVITRSSKGIGKAIAIEFAKEGYKVVLNGRDENSYAQNRPARRNSQCSTIFSLG